MAINGLNSNSIKMSGLASGLDTEALVKQMSALSKGRLNMQQQKLDLLQWKQVAYRKSISSITSFRDSYFNLLKPETNLGSNNVFATRKYTSSNEDLKVVAANNAAEGKYEISNIIQKATTAELTSEAASVNGIKLDITAKAGEEYKVNVNLDGLSKEITFTGGESKDKTAKNFVAALNEAFEGTNANFKGKDGVLTVRNTEMEGLCHNVKISAVENSDGTLDAEGLKALGVTNNVSNQMSINTKLSDVAFAEELKGNGFTFEINGEKFSFSAENTVNDVIKTINNSDAGVKMSYDKVSGKFNLESVNSGASSPLKIIQTSGNLLSSMFGADKIAAASSVSSNSLMSNGLAGVKPNAGEGFGFTDGVSGDLSEIVNQSFNVTVNGVEKRIALFAYDSEGKKNDFSKPSNVELQLNDELEKNFGSDAPTFSYDEKTQAFTLTSANKADVVSISAREEDITGGSQKLVTALGFNETNSTNEISQDQKLFEGVDGINATISFGDGKTLNLDSSSTIKDLVDGSFGNITFENGQLTLHGVDIDGTDDAGKTYLSSLFGDNYNYPGVPASNITPSFEATGENAIITVNGNTITSNSNSFTIDGTTLDVSGLETGEQDISVSVSNDTSKAKEAIKTFVEDYNKLVNELYGETKTKYDREFQPLTEEQREEMSDKEIEQWEEKAKTGLLYQDNTINRFLTDLRSSVSGISFNGMTIKDLGIETSSVYSENGKLTLDEAELDKALSENAEDIATFFTAENGFASRVSETLNDAVQTKGNNKGSLVSLAGVENTSSVAENRISKQIDSYKKALETLEERYENEQSRYWKQFTALETAMSSYNSQSSWLASQFSGQ